MAYFDNPEKAARWERELSALRAEKERRQASPPVLDRNVGISLSPAAVETRARFGMARVAEQKVWSPPVRLPATLAPATQKADKKKPVTLIHGEPLTFAQLVAELEEAVPEFVFTPEPEPEITREAAPPEIKAATAKFAIERTPITFEELMAEAGTAPSHTGSLAFAIDPPRPKAEPISFEKLLAESGMKKPAAKPAHSTGMSLCPAPELITFSQLKSEAGQKQAI